MKYRYDQDPKISGDCLASTDNPESHRRKESWQLLKGLKNRLDLPRCDRRFQ